MSNSVRSINLFPAPRMATASGRTLVAFGTRGPLFDQPQDDTDCPNCGGFPSVKVRDGRGGLRVVNCSTCTNHHALALTGR